MTVEVGPWSFNALEVLAATLGLSGTFFLLGAALLILKKRMLSALVGAGMGGFGYGGAALVMWTLAGMQGPLLRVQVPPPLDLVGATRGVHPVPTDACFIAVPNGAGPCPDPARTVHHVPGDTPADVLRPGMQIAVRGPAPRLFAILPIVGPTEGPIQRVHPTPRGGVLYGQAPLDRQALHAALEALPHDVYVDVHTAPPTTVADVLATCLSARPRACGVRQPPPPRVPNPIRVLPMPERPNVPPPPG